MKSESQLEGPFAHLAGLLEDISVSMLTHVDAEGSLVSRPMSPLEMDRHGALWFFIDLRHAKLEHLGAANLAFSDPAHAVFVSLSGRVQIQMDRMRILQLWSPLMRPWFPDGPDSEHLALLKFVPDAAEYWDAPRSRMMRMFALAASVLAGKPIAQGEHDVVPVRAKPLVDIATS